MSEVKFRIACDDDIPELTELRIKQLVDEGYPECRDIRGELDKYFSENLGNGTLVCWVGVLEDKIIATGGLCFYQLPCSFSNPTGKNATITNMYTDDDYRNQGIATFLVDKLLTVAKSLGYLSVRLHASTHGKSVYEKAGFVKADGYMSIKL